MLEHVSKAGSAFGVVDRAGVDIGVERYHRGLVPFEHDEMQAVGEGEFRYALLEFPQVLRGKGSGECDGDEQLCQFHVISLYDVNLADRVRRRVNGTVAGRMSGSKAPGDPTGSSTASFMAAEAT